MSEGLTSTVELNNGVRMPWFGLGVFQMDERETIAAVQTALKSGYRCIDTAALYRNERGVGRAILESGIPRDEVFITTKVWNDDVRGDRVAEAFEESLQRLGLDYLDLYLVHWPIGGKIASSWRVLEELYRCGRVKAIGVSNYMIPHLDELLSEADVVPAVNQIEFHPYLQSRTLHEYCRQKEIQLQAWSPLMQAGPILNNPSLIEIGKHHGKTAAQVILRWDLQKGVATIPKSAKPARIVENASIFNFTLTDGEMRAIDALERNQRHGADPFNFGF